MSKYPVRFNIIFLRLRFFSIEVYEFGMHNDIIRVDDVLWIRRSSYHIFIARVTNDL